MDPKACFADMLRALADRDTAIAREKMDELAGWLEKGGFMPSEIQAAAWLYSRSGPR
jgi:hypothetical protein